jgi:hypothetical protein
MDFKNKKVQYALIGSVAGLAFFFLVLQFVILPSLDSWKEDSAKAKTVQAKVSEMRAVVQTKSTVQGQIDAAKAALMKMDANIPLPVLGNYLLGMEDNIRACAQNLDVTLTTIADNDIAAISPENTSFKLYRVRVQIKAGFNEYIKLLKNIHAANPLCSISGLNITARDESPAVHEINFIVAWLIWSDPAMRPAFLIEAKK